MEILILAGAVIYAVGHLMMWITGYEANEEFEDQAL
jgi:hypothetical protein